MIENKILALKYRPQDFENLIGQEIIAKTIVNAIKIGKTPNAYLLTGIRGVGKTTTARLIAKALNCEKNTNKKINCNNKNYCNACEQIINSNHIDVLEMDAASKTGIDDIRELIENSKYSPASAKFKIFIIDEVHMLSKQAFNGLLKTLEEPPPSLKFILATTEIRKIPVTILSRCQRFDLKRVGIKEIILHLKKICEIEKGKISDEALRLIAQASEGSVRDAISLLDRALIFQNINSKEIVDDVDVRNMLGLADKTKTIQLVESTLKGDAKECMAIFQDLYNDGLDSKVFLNDILEILSIANRIISLGNFENNKDIPEAEINLIEKIAKGIDVEDIGLFWQLTLKTIQDLKVVGDEKITLEMFLLQMVHLKGINSVKNFSIDNNTNNPNLDIKEKSFVNNENENNASNKIKNQLKITQQEKTSLVNNPKSKLNDNYKYKINKFEDIVKLANKDNEIELKYDLERNVKLVNFKYGKIDISFNERLNKNFIKILTEKLLAWTGDRWIISLSKNEGEKSIFEKQSEEKTLKIEKIKQNETVKNLLSNFEDANLENIEENQD